MSEIYERLTDRLATKKKSTKNNRSRLHRSIAQFLPQIAKGLIQKCEYNQPQQYILGTKYMDSLREPIS